jgi:hypothetical protein
MYKVMHKLFHIIEAIMIRFKIIDKELLEHRFIKEMMLIE